MSAETFSERRAIARKAVTVFLGEFSPPRGLDDAALAKRVDMIADAFARRLPTTGEYAEHLARAFTAMRDTHVSNTWPSQAEFVAAMPAGERMGLKAAETYSPDDRLASLAAKMKRGDPVPESAVWGSDAARLASGGLIDGATLDAYREGSTRSFIAAYRKDAFRIMEQRLGDVARDYLRARA